MSLPYHDDIRRSVTGCSVTPTHSSSWLVLRQHYTLCETELGSRISTFSYSSIEGPQGEGQVKAASLAADLLSGKNPFSEQRPP